MASADEACQLALREMQRQQDWGLAFIIAFLIVSILLGCNAEYLRSNSACFMLLPKETCPLIGRCNIL